MPSSRTPASFCVVAKDTVVPEEYTTYFQSVIVFGQIRLIQDERAKRAAIEKLAGKYAPEATTIELEQEINREWNPLCLLEMTIDHVTGKEAIELCGKNSKHHKHSLLWSSIFVTLVAKKYQLLIKLSPLLHAG